MSETPDPVRLAIIGCGAAARACHVPALPGVTGGVLTAAVDTSLQRAEELVAIYRQSQPEGAPSPECFTSLEDAFDAFDAAVVATPHSSHTEVGRVLLAAGKHVLMEKPLAAEMQHAEDLAAAVRDQPDVVFAMAHPRRLFPAYAWVRRLITSGRLGDVSDVRWVEGGPYGWEPFSDTMFDRGMSGGGVLIDSASHIFDSLAWWFGDGLKVIDYRDSSRGGVESDAVATLASGSTRLTVELSRLRSIGTLCTVTGSQATVTIGTDFPAGECSLVSADGNTVFRGEVDAVAPARDTWEGLFEEQLEDFCAAVAGHRPATYSSIEDGLVALRLIDDCYAAQPTAGISLPWMDQDEVVA